MLSRSKSGDGTEMMNKEYYMGNRDRLYRHLPEGSLAVIFSGDEIRRSADECYDYFGNRNFLYLTGLQEKGLVLLAGKRSGGEVWEKLYLRTPDMLAERWSGKRIKAQEAADQSGMESFGYDSQFCGDFHRLAVSGNYSAVYLDAEKYDPQDMDTSVHRFQREVSAQYPYLKQENAAPVLRKLRTIKQPCEI